MVVAVRNLEDLRNPVHVTDFFSTETVSDHNQYVLADHVYQVGPTPTRTSNCVIVHL